MTLEQASLWLSGSILFILGSVVIIIGIVAINNILHNYWKPVTIFTRDSFALFGFSASTNGLKVTDEEYAKLTDYLEELRNPTKIEPPLENEGKK